ncbi:hypothetical protein B0T26DRAFT_600238, partial [Lasiosphaeria miniovina]
TPARRPYTGSCHCGAVRYIAHLTLPHTPPSIDELAAARQPGQQQKPAMRQFIYRCNCSTCVKMGLMHVRLHNPPADFQLLAPTGPDPLAQLGNYQCFERRLRFLFCTACGVRCLTFAGEGEVVESDVLILGEGGETKTERREVWSPKRGWVEGRTSYLSVNAYTLDAGQPGLDLREWTDKQWVAYVDCRSERRAGQSDKRYGTPFEGGAY